MRTKNTGVQTFEDVKTIEDLQIYLQKRAAATKRLYHYTTYESLIDIIKNKSFRLSRMDILNDKAEQTLGKIDNQSENYIMSFTQDKEYISMWAMYGKPSGLKIRLDFNPKKFITAITNNFFLDALKTNPIPIYSDNCPGIFSKKDFILSDIVYLDKGKKTLRHSKRNFMNITGNDSLVHQMAGFIKYDVWEFEKETRLRVRMHNNYSNSKNTNIHIPKYIFAGINDNLIEDFHITFNPWMSSGMKEEIQKSIKSLTDFEIKCNSSQHDGEIAEL